jgi:predicted  nucleic acid-binding Zn-ribbon protein
MYRSFIFLILMLCVSQGLALGQSTSTPSAPAARNAQASDEASALRALVEEVRLLRLALERSQRDAVLMQATVERLRLQQEAVNRLAQKLDDCRSELAAVEVGLARLPDHINDLERRMNGMEDATQRTLLESELKAAQMSLEDQKESANNQRQRAEQLKLKLHDEQQKLDELFERFTRYERPPEPELRSETTARP